MHGGAGVILGWVLVGVLVVSVWRLLRALRRSFRRMSQTRAEAFSNAVSEAVASGVASALSAAVADARAAATGGSVAVHIGDNLARLIANNYDGTNDYDNGSANNHHDDGTPYDDDMGSLSESDNRRGVGGLPNPARHGEHAGGYPVRRSNRDSASRRNAH